MGQPGQHDAYVVGALTDISVAYKQKAEAYIADKVFPTVGVLKQNGKIFFLDKNDWLRDEAQERAPATESAGSGFDITSSTEYFCKVYAIHKDIDQQMLANATMEDLEIQMAEWTIQKLLIKRERTFIANYITAGLWDTDATGGSSTTPTWPAFTYFDDEANSDPLGTIMRGKETVAEKTGYVPNILAVGIQVHNMLRRHADVKDQVKYTQSSLVSNAQLAEYFGVDKYLVAGSTYASNVEDHATPAYSFNFGKNMLLVYAPETAGLLTPSAGYVFEWTGFNDMGQNVKTKEMDLPLCEATRIEGQMAYHQKLLCSDLGVLYTGAIS